MTAVLLLSNALLDLLLAAVILRADRRRRDNQLLVLVGLLDATCDALVGMLLLRGFEITDGLPMQVCLVSRILIVHPVLEFVYAFPSDRRPPAWLRAGGLAATACAAFGALHPLTASWVDHWIGRLAFFVPFFIAVVIAARQNLTPVVAGQQTGGERAVLLNLVVRFGAEFVTWVVVLALFPGALQVAFALDVSIALLSYALIAHAVLRYRFFRVRGLLAETLVRVGFAAACLALVVTATELAARRVHEPVLRVAAFAAVILFVFVARPLMVDFAPRLESALLYPFDARRRLFRGILERTLRESVAVEDAAAACELTRAAIAALCGGSVLLWRVERAGDSGWRTAIDGPVLPPEVAAYLQGSAVPGIHRRSGEGPLHAQAFAALRADALVAVRAHGSLLCAFAINSRLVEQDLLDAAGILADSLGTKLVHQAMRDYAAALQSQLETSRRLTTLGSFVAAIAHDIRTPLTSVKMNLEMIQRSPELEPDTRQCSDLALVELRRMNDYVSGMLDYVKPIQLRVVELDVELLVDECTRVVQPLLDARRLTLQRQSSRGDRAWMVRADATRMRKVIVNLVQNAAHASGPGQTIEVSLGRLEPDRIAIRVRDHGCGIAPADLDRIFEPFFTTREQGTGLGLAIVDKLVRAHDGEVRVESVPDLGSTFTVVLPACEPR